MGHSDLDPTIHERRPFKPRDIWVASLTTRLPCPSVLNLKSYRPGLPFRIGITSILNSSYLWSQFWLQMTAMSAAAVIRADSASYVLRTECPLPSVSASAALYQLLISPPVASHTSE